MSYSARGCRFGTETAAPERAQATIGIRPIPQHGVKQWIVAVLLIASSLSRADFVLEAGPSNVSNEWTGSITLVLQERTDKWAFSVVWISPQSFNTCGRIDCQWDIGSQLGVGVERLFKWKRFTVGVGPYLFENTNRVTSSHLNVRIGLEFAASEHLSIKLLSHFSNADASEVIEVCNAVTCVSNDWNIGQDAVLLVLHF